MIAKVNIHKTWSKDEKSTKALMDRLHQIVSGTGNGPFKKNSGFAYQLDAANDWFAETKRIKEGVAATKREYTELTVGHRYSQSRADAVAQLVKEMFN